MEWRDRVVGKDELLERIWPGMHVEENNLATQVSALRRLLGRDVIATMSGRLSRVAVVDLQDRRAALRLDAYALETELLSPAALVDALRVVVQQQQAVG